MNREGAGFRPRVRRCGRQCRVRRSPRRLHHILEPVLAGADGREPFRHRALIRDRPQGVDEVGDSRVVEKSRALGAPETATGERRVECD